MALNKVILMGRITQELEIKETTGGAQVLQFTIAIDRYSKNSEEKQADFITCVAWRQTAEFIYKYFGKGRMIAVTGNLHSRTYDDRNGTKHYVTEVYIDSADFTGEPKAQQGGQQALQRGGNTQAQSYTPSPSQTPQTSTQVPQQANGGYSSEQMYAPRTDKAATDSLYPEFESFSDDGVPF